MFSKKNRDVAPKKGNRLTYNWPEEIKQSELIKNQSMAKPHASITFAANRRHTSFATGSRFFGTEYTYEKNKLLG